MLKIISCSALFLIFVMFNGLSLADIFKCTRPDGSIFFADDPSKVPRGCVIERIKYLPPVEKVPDTQQPPVPSAEISLAPQTQPGEMKSFESFKSEAALLVEKFLSARHRMARSSFVADELKAMRELADIKVQKTGFLSEIKQSSLSSSEKEELESLLSPITE
jgi:hypothetical protein